MRYPDGRPREVRRRNRRPSARDAGRRQCRSGQRDAASDNNSGRSVRRQHSQSRSANPPSVDYRTATPALFGLLRIPMRSGEDSPTDGDTGQVVVAIPRL
jgi:hypothetical protein